VVAVLASLLIASIAAALTGAAWAYAWMLAELVLGSTRIFLMMPPSRCWIVFRLDSDSTVPTAIAALSRDAKVDQVPRPRTKQPTSRFPVRVTPRSRSHSAGGADPKHRGTCQIAARANAILTRTIALGAKRSRECLITATSFPVRRQR